MRFWSWKVMAPLAAAGVGSYVSAPGVFAVPLLIVAACPLSMLPMVRASGSACGWWLADRGGRSSLGSALRGVGG